MEGKGNQELTHEEFDPFCKWHRKEDEDIVEIHLPEFNCEQLKVQITNSRILKISGERPLDASKKSKFYKEIQISSNYDASAIRAKLANGKLILTMPKGKTVVPQQDRKGLAEASKNDQTPKPEPTKDQTAAPPPSGGAVKDQIQTPGGISSAMCEFLRREPAASSFRLAEVAVTLAGAALIAYACCLCAKVHRC